MPNTREKLIELIEATPNIVASVEIMKELAVHLIANGVTVQKWIPVSERLPEPFTIVFIWDSTNKRVTDAYMTRHMEWVGISMSHEVTHWMPIPEPPKGE